MKSNELSKLLSTRIQELDSIDYLNGKWIQVMENIGDKWLDVVFNRQGENIYYEILLNGSKRGSNYEEASKQLEELTNLEIMGRGAPFQNFIVRFCLSSSPRFARPLLIAFYQENQLKVLTPDQRDEVLKNMEAKGMPIIYDSFYAKPVIENFMLTSVTGSLEKNGLLIYPSESNNVYILIKKAEASKNVDEKRAEELKQEFMNFALQEKNVKKEFETSRIDSKHFIDEIIAEIKTNPELQIYAHKMFEEAKISTLTAELQLVEYARNWLTKHLES